LGLPRRSNGRGAANLKDAHLAGLNLKRIRLKSAQLAGADFSRSELTAADLSLADLFGSISSAPI